MDYQETFRDEKLAKSLISGLQKFKLKNKVKIMEVCGTHTMTVHRLGIPSLLPENVKLLSGPGCPVCVTPVEYLDYAIVLSRKPDFIIATFGDLFRVPGSESDLRKEKARGGKIGIVYSPSQALEIAQQNPDKNVVFLGVGFETTLPGIAQMIKTAKAKNLKNFAVLLSARTIPIVLKVLASSQELSLSGFLLPGHVSCIIGSEAYQFLAKDCRISGAIAGFEPLDILLGVYKLLELIKSGKPEVLNLYPRAVKAGGNKKAQEVMAEVLEPCDIKWRGIGLIPGTGLKLREEFGDFDAEQRFPLDLPPGRENPKCLCGEILKGTKIPPECKLFGKACKPESPVGACMVSTEGTCAAYYKYGS